MVETFAVAVVGGLTGSACGAGILMWARHREREIDVEERSRDQMAAEANTFAGAAAAAQSLLTAAKWEGVRKDRDNLFARMMRAPRRDGRAAGPDPLRRSGRAPRPHRPPCA